MNRIYPLTNTTFDVVLRNYVLLCIFKLPRNFLQFAANNIGLFGLSGQRVATSVL